jgi:hypothetical protein
MEMKSNVLRFMASIIFVLMCLFFSFKFANAQEYLGEICWNVQHQGEVESDILQLGVLRYGDGHFTLNGKINNIDFYTVVHGNAELINGRIEMVLNLAEVDPFIVPSVVYVSLDPATLAGTFHELIFESNDGVNYFFDPVQGTFTPIACP